VPNYQIGKIFQSSENLTISESANINEEWNATWGSSGDDYCYSMAISKDGSIYLTGFVPNGKYGQKYLVLVKYYPNGTKEWNTSWGGPGNDRGRSVIVGPDGAIYVGGWTDSYGSGSSDFVILKFYSNGTLVWNNTWGSPMIDFGFSIAISLDGAIYMTGWTNYGAGVYDIPLVMSYPNGTKAWNVTWGGTNSDGAHKLKIGPDGSIYIVGFTLSFGPSNNNIALLKFSMNGTLIWNITWGGDNYDYGTDLIIANNGNIYVVGYSDSYGAGNNDIVILKFLSDGTKVWNITWGGPDLDNGYGIAKDNLGNLFITGKTKSYGAGDYDVAILKVNPNGVLLWNETWGTALEDEGHELKLLNDKILYICGTINKSTPMGNDFLLIKFKNKVFIATTPVIPGFDVVYLLVGVIIIIYLKLSRKVKLLI